MKRQLAILLVLLGGASYGLISPTVKMAYGAGFSPGDVTSGQYVLATVLLWVVALFRVSHFKRLHGRDLWLLVLLGLMSAGTSVLYYLSLSYLPASLAIVLLFQFAWVVMVIDYIVTRTRPRAMKWLALVCILLGTVWAVDLFHEQWSGVSTVGLLFGALSSLTYSCFLYFTGYVRTGVSPWVNSAIMATAATVAVCFVFPPTFLWSGALGHGLWYWALLIGLLGQVIPPVFFNIGIPKIGGSMAGVLGSVELPVAVVSAFLLLHEQVKSIQWVGIALILLGIAISEIKLRERKKVTV